MRKFNPEMKLIGIYLSMLAIIFIMFRLNAGFSFGKVIRIDDREEALKKINMSIPVKIEIFNMRWGRQVITEENTINQIWDDMNIVTRTVAPEKNKYPDAPAVTGTIFYLNGKQESFAVGQQLFLAGKLYSSTYQAPLIRSLKNNLLGFLYTAPNIAKTINTCTAAKISSGEAKTVLLRKNQRLSLATIVQKAERVEKQADIVHLLMQKGQPLYRLYLYFTPPLPNGGRLSDSVAVLDIYQNFFVLQYMGDNSGDHTFFRGRLSALCASICHQAGDDSP